MTEPWKNEPNNFGEVYRAFRLKILRHPELQHLCGYVQVPNVYLPHFKEFGIHWGWTYEDDVLSDEHLEPGNTWLGFDCAHAGDYVPGQSFNSSDAVYRDFEFVRRQLHDVVDEFHND